MVRDKSWIQICSSKKKLIPQQTLLLSVSNKLLPNLILLCMQHKKRISLMLLLLLFCSENFLRNIFPAFITPVKWGSLSKKVPKTFSYSYGFCVKFSFSNPKSFFLRKLCPQLSADAGWSKAVTKIYACGKKGLSCYSNRIGCEW